jgi:hypothetical protein
LAKPTYDATVVDYCAAYRLAVPAKEK